MNEDVKIGSKRCYAWLYILIRQNVFFYMIEFNFIQFKAKISQGICSQTLSSIIYSELRTVFRELSERKTVMFFM